MLQESGISAVFSESTSSTSNHQVLTALRAVHRQAILKVTKDADISTLFVGAGWYAVKQFGSCGWACFNIAHREGRDTFCIRMKLAADMGRKLKAELTQAPKHPINAKVCMPPKGQLVNRANDYTLKGTKLHKLELLDEILSAHQAVSHSPYRYHTGPAAESGEFTRLVSWILFTVF